MARFQYQVKTEPVFTSAAEIVTVDKWYRPLSEPSRKSVLKTASQQAYFSPTFTPAEIILESEWHQPWSEPVRRKALLQIAPDIAWAPFTPAGEIITLDKWYFAWSLPRRNKSSFTALLAFSPAPVVPSIGPATGLVSNMSATAIRRYVRTNAY